MSRFTILFIEASGRTILAENSTAVYTSWAINPLKGFKVTPALLFTDEDDEEDYIIFPDENKIDEIMTALFSLGKVDLRELGTVLDADEFEELDYADTPDDSDVESCRKSWYKYVKKNKYLYDKYISTIPIEYR